MIHERIVVASVRIDNAWVHNPYPLADPRTIIRTLRAQRGFRSDTALATAAGIPQPTLARYLNGTSDTMEVASFVALAKVLEVTMSELLGEVALSSRSEVRELAKIMESLQEPEREALLAAGRAMAEVRKRN